MISPIPWLTPSRANVDRDAAYLVATNDGAFEIWPGSLLLFRLRKEFVVGRAVKVAMITEPVVEAEGRAA